MRVCALKDREQRASPVSTCPNEGENAVSISVLRSFEPLAGRAREWNALVGRAGTKSVFQTYEFHLAWWKTFGADHGLLLILAEHADKIVGIAPLVLAERSLLGWRRRAIQFIGGRLFDYTDFIVDRSRPDVLPLLLNKLLEIEPACDGIYLRDVPSGSQTIPLVRSFFQSRGRIVDVRLLFEAPARVLDDAAADRRLLAKKSLKRHYNGLKKLGDVDFVNCTNADEVFAYLEAFFEQHVRRRARTDTPSLFLDDRTRVFFSELVFGLCPQGWLLFSVLLLNRRPVAMHFGFEFQGCITWYKPAFDIDMARHSPGEVLIRYLLEYAIERGAQELDFTIGAEPFKYRFANCTRSTHAVRVYRRRLPYLTDRLLLEARRLVERVPPVERVARRALNRLRTHAWF